MINEIYEKAHNLAGIDKDNFKTWSLLQEDGFFDIWNTPTYNEIRQNPMLYSIWAQLLKNPKLTIGMDRVCMKPPAWIETKHLSEDNKEVVIKKEWKQTEFLIHNDMNLWDLSQTKYQGGLALSDCAVGQGGFRCIPRFHKLSKIKTYRENYELGKFTSTQQPPPKGSFVYFLDNTIIAQETIEIPMEKGDFVIWNSRLPHANSINTTNKWRLQAFIRFVPCNKEFIRYRENVAESIKTGIKPRWFSTAPESLAGTGTENRKWEMSLHKVPELNWLSERIFGITEW